MKKFLQQIGSLRITVTVVLLIAGYSMYGTFLKQEVAMESVYRSVTFLCLLVLFGINLFACTVLRLRFRLAQAGFLATHLGVLVVLAGAIVGAAGGERGSLKLSGGESSGAYYKRVRVSPEKNRSLIESVVGAAGGRVVERDEEKVTVVVPRDNVHEAMHSLGKKLTFEIIEADEETATVRFWLDVEIAKKPLPFTIRLDRFAVDYYNHGDLIVTDREGNIIKTIPAKPGASAAVGDYEITVGEFLPNFVIDADTREATTRNRAPENPAIHLHLSKLLAPTTGESLWVFTKHPGIEEHMRRGKELLPFLLFFDYRERVKSYVSEITILDEAGSGVKKAAVKVNQPLTHRGYTIYQSSYDREGHEWTGLQVVKDPGLWVVYVGFALLLAGVGFIFYAKPYLRRRKKSGATTGVAGESMRAIP